MEIEIRVDRTRCIGSGQCVHWAPGVFDQDDEAIAVVVDPRGAAEEKIVQAVTACPMRAISLHVDGTAVRAEDLEDWVRGAVSTDPLVPLLEELCDDHHELRAALAPTSSGDDAARAEEMCSRTRAHLDNEDHVYAAITALVGPHLVDAFQDDHTKILEALDELAAHGSDPATRLQAMNDLARAVDDHIRLEETVLFPVALAALVREPAEESVTTKR